MLIKQVAFYSSITSIFYILIMLIVWADSFETGGGAWGLKLGKHADVILEHSIIKTTRY